MTNKEMKKSILVLSFGLILISLAGKVQADWLGEWDYRREITITSSTTTMLNDYQIFISTTYLDIPSEHRQSDYADVRFTIADGTTTLNYWIDPDTTNTRGFWVKVSTIQASTDTIIYVYYGNDLATGVSNIKNTFIPGDDFNDNILDPEIWTIDIPVGSVTEQNQQLEIAIPQRTNGDWWYAKYAPICYTSIPPEGNWCAVVKLKEYTVNNYTHAGIMLYKDRNNVYLSGRYESDSYKDLRVEMIINGSGTRGPTVLETNLPIYLRIRHFENTVYFDYGENGIDFSNIYSTSLTATFPYVGLFAKKWDNNLAITAPFDDFRISKYVSPEPTIKSVGNEEKHISPAAITNLSALTSVYAKQINLSWTAPGNDGTQGNIVNGKYTLQYATYSVSGSTYSSEGYRITWDTNIVAQASQSKVITGLTGGSTYYFYLWTADNSLNWSEISNGATAYAQEVSLSISVDPGEYDFGLLNASSMEVSTNAIVITNPGNVYETYHLKCSSSTPNNWQPVTTTPDQNDKFRFLGLFNSDKPATDAFDCYKDYLDIDGQTSTNEIFFGDYGGKDIDINEERKLWFRLEMPAGDPTSVSQSIEITITAIESE